VRPPVARERFGGAEGNERLTALTGAVLLLLLAAEGSRLWLLIASLAAGLMIALLTVHLAGAWESPGRVFFRP